MSPKPPQFSDDEAERLRELLRQKSHAKWLWASLRTWFLWVAALGSALHWGWAALSDIVTAFFTNH